MTTYEDIIKNIKILLADDDEDYLLMTYSFLRQLGYNVDKVNDGNQAIEALNKKDYQIALLDYFMPGLNGEEVIKKIRETNKELIIILQTGFSGQKPPIETMQTLNIQNYFDKTEGIDKLNLELISAVKIFKQQNEIELSKYRHNAIGSLIAGIAQEIKNDLLAVSGAIEVTDMLLKESKENVSVDEIKKINEIHTKNRETLLNIDKVLNSLINQSADPDDSVMEGNEIFKLINLIIKNDVKIKNIDFKSNVSLRPNSYIKGNVNDVTFIICEIIRNIIKVSQNQSIIEFNFTEDESNWIFNIKSSSVANLQNSFIYLIKMIIASIDDVEFKVEENNQIIINMKKI